MYQSLCGKTIIFPEENRNLSLDEILASRFENDDSLYAGIGDLLDPLLLKDMDRAIQRIDEAKQKDEKIIIFGDYDVDGVTATSLLMHFFLTLGLKVSYRLPHRVHDGYGLKKKFVDEAFELGVSLIITVDCGSRDAEIVSYGKEKGIDIIVTDHHHVPEKMPEDAQAFINPNRPDCPYPYKGLSGAGVAFKLITALSQKYFSQEKSFQYIQESIDIAAIGTVADCMNITGENRVIVKQGLKQIRKSRSKGVQKMIEGKKHEDIDADIFGFHIGPRLNAAGRMDTPYKAVQLILNNSSGVDKILQEIEDLNILRKEKTAEFYEDALNIIDTSHNIIIYHSPQIEHGIIGIVAGRLTEKFHKPSIVLIDEGDHLVASCRSPEFFSMVDLLEEFHESFVAFGGHKQAAGFTIKKEKFSEFCDAIYTRMKSYDFSQEKKIIEVTQKFCLEDIGYWILETLKNYQPFGRGNEKPLFLLEKFIPTKIAFLGSGRDHLKFENPYGFKIFGFGLGEHKEKLETLLKSGAKLIFVFDISEDNYNGKRGILLKILDIIVD